LVELVDSLEDVAGRRPADTMDPKLGDSVGNSRELVGQKPVVLRTTNERSEG
jgi:hypothetical protein